MFNQNVTFLPRFLSYTSSFISNPFINAGLIKKHNLLSIGSHPNNTLSGFKADAGILPT
jgi:hypothetical protein